MSSVRSQNPWYRQPWPWILMAGPALVLVAGTITTVIAVITSDGLVADDYYRQGLEINRVIAREERAHELGVAASLLFNEERDRARVVLASRGTLPPLLRLTLLHPTRSGEDQVVALSPVAPGLFEGPLVRPKHGAWKLQLEDGAATWRVNADWRTASDRITFGEAAP